jgi:NAD(P)-dependent dehydrogenase (short-subunit alcohol dehydrogenase family)
METQPAPIVLITGASKGIGAATAVAFAQAGYDVCGNFHSDKTGADDTVARCQAAGARAVAIKADVADRHAVRRMFEDCDAALGPVRCLVNNAGIIGGSTSLESLTESALPSTFATNLFGAVYCLQEAIPRLRNGGAIVNISSVAATAGSPGEYVHYAASKGALETLTIGAAKELGPEGIRVAAIRVGTTATDIHDREGNPDRRGMVAAMTPLGRIAQPDDIAEAAVWLASPSAQFVSGTVLTVAGGLSP